MKNEKHQCPFCFKAFDKFLPKGFNIGVLKGKKVIGGGRRLARCPFCKSSDRERLLYFFIKNKTNLFKTNKTIKLLHVAPEKNLQKVLKPRRSIEYISVDLNSHLAAIKMDITNLLYENNYFDIIICNHVLEHVPQDIKAMSELYRVLKPKGWAILQVPISPILKSTLENPSIMTPKQRINAFGQKDHVRIYGKDYKNRLENVNFKVQLIDFVKKELSKTIRNKYGLNKEETIYFCTK